MNFSVSIVFYDHILKTDCIAKNCNQRKYELLLLKRAGRKVSFFKNIFYGPLLLPPHLKKK